MSLLYWLTLSLHLLAALTWLGGMLFLALVGAPVLRTVEPPAVRQRLFDALGRRSRSVGWVAIGVLLVTGVVITGLRGWWGVMDEAEFWRVAPGRTLLWKLLLVAAMLALSAVHDFQLGPAAGRAEPGSEEALRLRRRAALNARVTALLGVALVLVAARLARGA